MKWRDEWKNPKARCRIKPFWFWNGDLTDEELMRQLDEMAKKGLGGAFICARQGQNVPYLSHEWFEKIKRARDHAKSLGLETWLYDEYPYPSGMSGGEVLLRHPEAEHMVLKHFSQDYVNGGMVEMNLGWCEPLYAAAFPVKDTVIDFSSPKNLMEEIGILQTQEIYQTTGLTSYNHKRFFTYRPEKILRVVLPDGHWRVEVYVQTSLGDFKYYGGYFDPCCKEAVQTFLETTHEKYERAMGESFGNEIFGMFSDEVGLLSPIPWSKRLPEYFQRIKGYSILEHLPALHHAEYENAYAIRYDLYDAMHKLFVETYHKQVSDWCKDHHLEYATEVPSMRMTTQRHSTIVGGDTAHEKLGRSLDWIYDKYLHRYRSNARAVSSLARQLGKQFAMIESFHSVGWSMTLQDAKWMFDRLAAEGINFYNVHAFYYTTDSITKHDAPPSQFIQNPYWKYYRLLADYVGRLGTWVTNTEADIHLAVLDPAANLWALLGEPSHGFVYQGESEQEKMQCEQMREDWTKVCKELIFAQIGYEHLDAEILKEARIEEGKVVLGKASYQTIVVPPCDWIESFALEKLREFVQSGGSLIFLGRRPYGLIDKKQEKIAWGDCGTLFENVSDPAWTEICRKVSGQQFEISGGERSLLSSIREDEENWYVFLANQGEDPLTVTIKPTGKTCYYAGQMSLENGEESYSGEIPLQGIRLTGYESKLLRYEKERGHNRLPEPDCTPIVLSTKGELPVAMEGENVFRLEQFDLSRDGVRWHPVEAKTFVEQCVDCALLEATDYCYNGEFGTPKRITPAYPMNVTYRTRFYIEEMPKTCALLMDQHAILGEWKLHCNGHLVEREAFASKWVYDHSNWATDVLDYLKLGWNELRVEVCVAKDEDGLRDPLYLIGDFGVSEKVKIEGTELRGITKIPQTAAFSLDYVRGFPFYSGTLTFQTRCNLDEVPEQSTITLDIGDACHECVELIMNGHSLGVRAFAPYRWKCEGNNLCMGENVVEIRRTNTLAAMLDGTWFDEKTHQLKTI